MTGIPDISYPIPGPSNAHPAYNMRRKGKTLSPNVLRLQEGLVTYLNDREQSEFLTTLEEYNTKRNVFGFVQTLHMMLDTPAKRQLIPLLRRVIPRADVTMFDHFNKQILSVKPLKTESGKLYRTHSTLSVPAGYHYGTTRKNLNGFYTLKSKLPFNPWKSSANFETKRLVIERSGYDEEWGFSIRGGAEYGIGIYVSYVDVESVAERHGLIPGDLIIEANSVPFDRISHSDASELIRTSLELELYVRNMGRVPGSLETHQTYTWVDPAGRPVSPPPEIDRAARYDTTAGQPRSGLMLLKDSDERKVNVSVKDGHSLGAMLRGGNDFGLGIYITGIDRRSVAEQAGLRVGDQILDVNGKSFLDISHNNAVKVLKSTKHLMMTIKDVGKLPHSRTTYDEPALEPQDRVQNPNYHMPTSCKSTPASARRTPESVFSRGAGSQLMLSSSSGQYAHWGLLKKKAEQLLTKPEQEMVNASMMEYQQGHITVTGLIKSLLNVFNTPVKMSLMSDIRGLLSAQDLDKYDTIMIQSGITTSNLKRAKSAEAVFPETVSDQSEESWMSSKMTSSSLLSGKSSSMSSVSEGMHTFYTYAPPESEDSDDSMEHMKAAIKLIDVEDSSSPEHEYEAIPFIKKLKRLGSKRSKQQKVVADIHNSAQGEPNKSPSEDSGVEINGNNSKIKAPPKPPRLGIDRRTETKSAETENLSMKQMQPAKHKSIVDLKSKSRASDEEPSLSPSKPLQINIDQPSTSHSTIYPARRDSTDSHRILAIAESLNNSSASIQQLKKSHGNVKSSNSKEQSEENSGYHSLRQRIKDSRKSVMSLFSGKNSDKNVFQVNDDLSSAVPQKAETSYSMSRPEIHEALPESLDILPPPDFADDQEIHVYHRVQVEDTESKPNGYMEQRKSTQKNQPTNLSMTSEESTGTRLLHIPKSRLTLGLAVEGGANTRQPLPRIINIQPDGCAGLCKQLKVGHVILEVNGTSLQGLEHREAARTIALAFKNKQTTQMSLLVRDPGYETKLSV